MRFEEAYQGWTGGRLTQAEAAMVLGQCERSFRRHVERYKADGLEGLRDRRLSQVSKRRASAAEADQVVQTYKSGFADWNVAHFHSKYVSEFKGGRSYGSVKKVLQGAGLPRVAKRRGKHRIKREPAPLPGRSIIGAAAVNCGVQQRRQTSLPRQRHAEVVADPVAFDDDHARAHKPAQRMT